MTSPMISPPVELFDRAGGRRVFFVWSANEGRLVPSHASLADVAEAITANTRDFDRHEAIFLEHDAESGAVFCAFLHRTVRGQGAGGVRHWRYEALAELVTDGLRLSRGMGRKNALAGLWWGGGKGIIARGPEARYEEPDFRRDLYRRYGRFISSLRGTYVTAEDVGTGPADMAEIFTQTRFTTCIPPALGGSGNPSPWTARGVVAALEAALEHLDLGALAGKRVAMQGAGNVGGPMVDLLVERGVASIVATEIDAEARARVIARHPGPGVSVVAVAKGDVRIFDEPCDLFVPNALGDVLGPDTIPRLRARVVCGAANNQLLDERRDAASLAARDIVFVPDFIANLMGIVNCSNEQYGTLDADPAIERHLERGYEHSIYQATRRVLERAQREGTTPSTAAATLADELSREPHPIFGHRALAIVHALVVDRWERR